MEIVIGRSPLVGESGKKINSVENGFAEARLLGMRFPRKPRGLPSNQDSERRSGANKMDPANSKVLTLLVLDEKKIPKDISTTRYKIMMKFVPERRKNYF